MLCGLPADMNWELNDGKPIFEEQLPRRRSLHDGVWGDFNAKATCEQSEMERLEKCVHGFVDDDTDEDEFDCLVEWCLKDDSVNGYCESLFESLLTSWLKTVNGFRKYICEDLS